MKSAMNRRSLPFPFPCLRTYFNNKGPGRNKFSGKCLCLPLCGKNISYTTMLQIITNSQRCLDNDS